MSESDPKPTRSEGVNDNDSTKKETVSQEEPTAVSGNSSSIDLLSYHEQNAGRLVIDPE